MKTILVDAVDTFDIEVNGVYQIFEPMHQLLEEFPNKKILVTGANDEQFKEWNLDKMPYEVFTLKHNPDKIDPRYFQTLLTKYNLTAADVIYFEHNPEAVKSAESVGIESYQYDETKADLSALRKFLEENV